MFYNTDLLNLLAKRLAMLASDRVSALAEAATGDNDYAPQVTGTLLGLMPHMFEKAIITSPSLPGDVAAGLAKAFVKEFEAVVKMVSNAGGFSNPIKKALFNAGFHTMFRREYDVLKPQIDGLWKAASEQQANPLECMAYLVLKRAEAASGKNLDSDQRIASISNAVVSLFKEVHAILGGA